MIFSSHAGIFFQGFQISQNWGIEMVIFSQLIFFWFVHHFFPDNLVELPFLPLSQSNFARISTIPARFHKIRNIPDPGLPTALPVSQKISGARFHGMPHHTLSFSESKNKNFHNHDPIKIYPFQSIYRGEYGPGFSTSILHRYLMSIGVHYGLRLVSDTQKGA